MAPTCVDLPASAPLAAALAMTWGLAPLQQQVQPLWPGLQLQVLAEAGSTNTLLIERARQGDASPCVLVAEQQTQGRGRQGKVWQSVAGASLTFSLSLLLAMADWSGLSLAVGLALAEALDPSDGLDPEQRPGHAVAARAPRIGLKWPNDLLLVSDDGISRKLGGILIESLPVGSQRLAVIGIGLNIAPAALQGLSLGYGCLQQLQPDMTAPATLARVLLPLLTALRAFEHNGFAPLRARYGVRDALLGQTVTTTLPGLPEGVAEGVADNGALWVRAGSQRHAVSSGEVSVRAAGAAVLPAALPGALPGTSPGTLPAALPQQVTAC